MSHCIWHYNRKRTQRKGGVTYNLDLTEHLGSKTMQLNEMARGKSKNTRKCSNTTTRPELVGFKTYKYTDKLINKHTDSVTRKKDARLKEILTIYTNLTQAQRPRKFLTCFKTT